MDFSQITATLAELSGGDANDFLTKKPATDGGNETTEFNTDALKRAFVNKFNTISTAATEAVKQEAAKMVANEKSKWLSENEAKAIELAGLPASDFSGKKGADLYQALFGKITERATAEALKDKPKKGFDFEAYKAEQLSEEAILANPNTRTLFDKTREKAAAEYTKKEAELNAQIKALETQILDNTLTAALMANLPQDADMPEDPTLRALFIQNVTLAEFKKLIKSQGHIIGNDGLVYKEKEGGGLVQALTDTYAPITAKSLMAAFVATMPTKQNTPAPSGFNNGGSGGANNSNQQDERERLFNKIVDGTATADDKKKFKEYNK